MPLSARKLQRTSASYRAGSLPICCLSQKVHQACFCSSLDRWHSLILATSSSFVGPGPLVFERCGGGAHDGEETKASTFGGHGSLVFERGGGGALDGVEAKVSTREEASCQELACLESRDQDGARQSSCSQLLPLSPVISLDGFALDDFAFQSSCSQARPLSPPDSYDDFDFQSS